MRIMDKLPPQSINAEESLISAVLINNKVIPDILDILKPEDFYRSAHQKIFKCVFDMFDKKDPVDLVTLPTELKNRSLLEEIGGASYLAGLVDNVPLSTSVKKHSKIIKEASIKRSIIEKCNEALNQCFDNTQKSIDISDGLIQDMMGFDDQNKSEAKWLKDVMIDCVEDLEEKQKTGVTGLKSGFHMLDSISCGFHPGDLLILAARPAMGKTSFMWNVAENITDQTNKPVAVFSLEMPSLQLGFKTIGHKGRLNTAKFRNGKLNQDDWKSVMHGASYTNPILINDNFDMSSMDIRRAARKYKKKHDICCVFVDYMQLIQSDKGNNREQEIAYISRNMKGMARELNIPVVALSQLNRMVEQRNDKRPMLSDLRESGSIEQDADGVMFIYRDEVYNTDNNNPNKGKAEILIKKNRHGACGTAYLSFIKERASFENLHRE